MELTVKRSVEGAWTIIHLEGELDLYTTPRAKQEILSVLQSAEALIVDLDGVDFMDSSGLGALMSGLKRAREKGGKLVLAGPREAVAKVLSISGLDKVFSIYPNIEAAMADQ